MTDLRSRMLADLRARGVFAMAKAQRDLAIDRMLAGAILPDGTEVCVTSGDWREVIAHADAIHGDQPSRRAALLAAALADPEEWLELVSAAQDWRSSLRDSAGLSQDPGSSDRVMRPPARLCWDACGGTIEEPIASGFSRRWVCSTCGLEWRAATRDGAPIAQALESAPRWLGQTRAILFGERG